MNLVLDASMALAWLFERQDKNEALLAEKTLMTIAESETIVPTLWHIEIANVLIIGERHKVITEAQTIDYLNRLSKLPIITDDAAAENRQESIMALAREYQLTAYDATYLELALRSNATLATFDVKLTHAIQKAGGQLATL